MASAPMVRDGICTHVGTVAAAHVGASHAGHRRVSGDEVCAHVGTVAAAHALLRTRREDVVAAATARPTLEVGYSRSAVR